MLRLPKVLLLLRRLVLLLVKQVLLELRQVLVLLRQVVLLQSKHLLLVPLLEVAVRLLVSDRNWVTLLRKVPRMLLLIM